MTGSSPPGPAGGQADPRLGAVLRSDAFRDDLVRQIGGWRGMVESSVPVAVFVVANVVTSLRPALWAAVGTVVLLAGFRLARRESPRQALNGAAGIVVAAVVAARTGRAEDFYLPGILIGAAYGLAFALSVLVRRPLVGVVWAYFSGAAPGWREDRRLFRAFTLLTAAWAGLFLLRAAVQGGMYLADASATALGVARLAMGYPPLVLLLVVTLWQVRRVTREAVPPPPAVPA